MEFDDMNDGKCERCGCSCCVYQFSCHPCADSEMMERAGIDPVLCEECIIIFIMIFAPKYQYIVESYLKNTYHEDIEEIRYLKE
jgi:hypothetical protein